MCRTCEIMPKQEVGQKESKRAKDLSQVTSGGEREHASSSLTHVSPSEGEKEDKEESVSG